MPIAHAQWLRSSGRMPSLALAWIGAMLLVATLEKSLDPLTAWEHLLEVLFGLGIPCLGLFVALALYGQLARRDLPMAMAARHGANRRMILAWSLSVSTGLACILVCITLVGCRAICHVAQEGTFNRDLLRCCGIGCLATAAYIGLLLAATRVGLARSGAWAIFGIDLTLGHINSGWLLWLPHPNIINLIGHPGFFLISAKASSWILLGFVLGGASYGLVKTPR